jgi:hypothetical protein
MLDYGTGRAGGRIEQTGTDRKGRPKPESYVESARSIFARAIPKEQVEGRPCTVNTGFEGRRPTRCRVAPLRAASAYARQGSGGHRQNQRAKPECPCESATCIFDWSRSIAERVAKVTMRAPVRARLQPQCRSLRCLVLGHGLSGPQSDGQAACAHWARPGPKACLAVCTWASGGHSGGVGCTKSVPRDRGARKNDISLFSIPEEGPYVVEKNE